MPGRVSAQNVIGKQLIASSPAIFNKVPCILEGTADQSLQTRSRGSRMRAFLFAALSVMGRLRVKKNLGIDTAAQWAYRSYPLPRFRMRFSVTVRMF